MDAFFARQPILTDRQNLYGYELLYRPNSKASDAGKNIRVDGDRATTSILNVVDWGGIERITNGTLAFVNFTEQLLKNEVAVMYPKKHLVVEVLETVEITPEVLNALRALKQKGYMIALDDYVYQANDQELLGLCDILKVEVNGTPEAWENLRRVADAAHRSRCKVLAEKVETEQDYERARAMGCSLFQGYYFAKPKLVVEKTISPMKINQIRLLNEIAKPGADFSELAAIIKHDVGLSAKTLRLVSSAYYGLQDEVKSITQAVALLGTNEMRRWLIYSSLNDMCDGKPPELVVMSMVRAHFCEQIAHITKHRKDAEAYFLVGLFSLLDVLTGTELEGCLSRMSIPGVTKVSLLEKDNDGHYALELITALEKGDWETVAKLCGYFGLEEAQVSEQYLDSIEWGQQFARPVP